MFQLFRKFDYLSTVASTNDYLRDFIEARVPRIVVANEQTGGKGRYGRKWLSPAGQGLYVSYLLYPGWEVERSSFLNIISALAVTKTIGGIGESALRVRLKRPNDVLIGEKKVCGILTEVGSLNDRIDWAIVGIGVNLYQKEFPSNLRRPATSLTQEGLAIEDPLEFCDRVTAELESLYARLEEGEWRTIREEYESRSVE